MTEAALEKLRTIFDAVVALKDEHLGNGRYVVMFLNKRPCVSLPV
jgi:hypothetical protein